MNDLIVFGRAAVDLYGEERGAGLADAARFRKSVGGAAANAAIAAQRLGVQVGLLTRLGEDDFGAYVRRSLRAEGIDTSFVQSDPARLTGLVVLAMEGPDSFPHLFYRNECADEAVELEAEQASALRGWLGRAKTLLLTGTHLRTPRLEAMSHRLAEWARAAGVHVVLDVDYRPSLWGDVPPGAGAARGLARPEAAAGGPALRRLLPLVDTIVGTEEELAVAAGTRAEASRQALLAAGPERVVGKRGPRGAWSVGPEGAVEVDGHGVPVLNVLGAGDAFIGAWLAARTGGEAAETRLRWGNAAGALVVSRHACAPAMPTRDELMAFLDTDERARLAAADALHRCVRPQRIRRRPLYLLALDHRAHFEALAAETGQARERIAPLKAAIFRGGCDGFEQAGVQTDRTGFIIDDDYGADLFPRVGARFLARPIEDGRRDDLAFIGGREAATVLRTWPVGHGVKCKVVWREAPRQVDLITALADACRDQERPLILELLLESGADHGVERLPEIMTRLYRRGVRPELWKLAPPPDAELWSRLESVLEAEDPGCDGVLLLGNGSPQATVAARLEVARPRSAFAGVAFGRTIFADAARAFMTGEVDLDEVQRLVAERWCEVLELARAA